MQEASKRRGEKAGLPPGTPVYVGERPVEPTLLSFVLFDGKNLQEQVITSVKEFPKIPEGDAVLWIQITGLSGIDVIQELGNRFQLNPLVLEDIPATDQRPKLENYGKYEYVVLKALEFNSLLYNIDPEQISLILGSNYVISIQERQSLLFNTICEWIQNNSGDIRTRGSHYLFYALFDAVVDRYFSFLETFGECIEDVESELITEPTKNTLQKIYQLKRVMIQARQAVWPLREVTSRLEREEQPVVREKTGHFLRDIYDHVIRVLDTIEAYRDTLSGMLDIYLSSTSFRMNEVMKVLTIVATVFIPLTLLVGIYGMNFPNMPEFYFPWSYPLLLVVMLAIIISLLAYFRRKRWL